MPAHKILDIAAKNTDLADILSKELGISKVLAQVLINRGVNSPQDAEKFLKVDLDYLLDPYSFSDMHKAVNLIKRAVANKQRAMVFSDYDVDGITSLVLLKSTLSKIGLDAVHYLPHRIKEGYGLNKNILNIVKQRNVKLLITADCGTNSHREIKELRSHNVEVIVTDHHEPLGNNSTSSSAIINPKLKGSNYKYRDLAGVGVAYKLCQALRSDKLLEDLDIVSLGTIADVVPLTGENRIMVKEGLSRISQTKRLGIKALIEISGIRKKEITSEFVSFILGPRLNASGRMDSAEASLNLLMSEQENEAGELAKIVDRHNRQRQKIENKILEEAVDLIDKEVNFKEHKIIVVAQENWHQGILGIVASKLADRFYRPTIIISKAGNLCKGSGRSIKNFHLFEALLECKDLLEAFGGHQYAAGLVITKDNIEGFKNKINNLAKERLALQDLLPSLSIDMELDLLDLNEAVVGEFELLEPFGMGNPEPLFYTRNLKIKGEPQALGRDTLKFWVSDDDVTYQAIGFGMAGLKDSVSSADSFDLVYTPKIDNWQGEGSVLLEIKEIFFR